MVASSSYGAGALAVHRTLRPGGSLCFVPPPEEGGQRSTATGYISCGGRVFVVLFTVLSLYALNRPLFWADMVVTL